MLSLAWLSPLASPLLPQGASFPSHSWSFLPLKPFWHTSQFLQRPGGGAISSSQLVSA